MDLAAVAASGTTVPSLRLAILFIIFSHLSLGSSARFEVMLEIVKLATTTGGLLQPMECFEPLDEVLQKWQHNVEDARVLYSILSKALAAEDYKHLAIVESEAGPQATASGGDDGIVATASACGDGDDSWEMASAGTKVSLRVGVGAGARVSANCATGCGDAADCTPEACTPPTSRVSARSASTGGCCGDGSQASGSAT